MLRYDVFLSHASADKPAVEYLAHKLRGEKLKPFLDKWHLVPGEPWQEALEEALDQSRTCAVFIGKAWGSWQHEEMRSALETRVRTRSFRVIPVLLPGGQEPGQEELPRFLRRLTWVDFRAGLDDEEAFHRLLAGIQGKAPGPGGGGSTLLDRGAERAYRCLAPAREPFVQRREYEDAVQALLGGSGGDGALTVGLTTALQGAGGFGKTALAIELCYDSGIRDRFPDGILWAQMRDNLDSEGRLKVIRDLLRSWTQQEPPAFETVFNAGQSLKEQLQGKRVLLVVDDAWTLEDVSPFQSLHSEAALLVTTRIPRALSAETIRIRVDAMESSKAVELLGTKISSDGDSQLASLSARLGKWPLLLKIVNRQLRERTAGGVSLEEAIREIEEGLEEEGVTAFDREEARNQAVALTVGVSLQRMPTEDISRFSQLAIFPEDLEIPIPVLGRLWGLSEYKARKICEKLWELSLLLRFDKQTIRLHDVIRAYLLRKGESHLVEWHRCLLDVFRPTSGQWPNLPKEEIYLWNHLFHHLKGAGQSGECRNLLLDFRYLQSKLAATDISALFADYSPFVENESEIWLVRDALRLSAHILTRNPAELPGQLLARLLDRQEPRIQELLAHKISGAPWLRPRKVSLVRPGGALIRVLEGHSRIVSAVAVLDSRRVVSSSYDRTLGVWDVESGQTLQTLKGHSYWVSAVAVLDSRRVVSGSSDRTLRVWDVESGQTLQTLKGHSYGVSAVAVLDNSRVVSGSSDGTLRMWDVESGQTLQTLKGHSDGVSAVAVLDNRRVVSGSSDRTLRVWDVESGQTLQTLRHSYGVSAVAVLDNSRVISSSSNGTLRVWDVESGQTLQTLEGHSAGVSPVAVLNSRRVVSGFSDGTLRVWDVESGQTLQTLEGHSDGVSAVAVLDSRRVVTGSYDRTLRVWDVESGQTLQTLEGHSDEVSAVAVLDSRRVVSGSYDRTLHVWDVESGQTLQALKGHSYGVSAVAVLDSRRVVSGSYARTLRVWDVESGQTLQTLEGHSDRVSALAALDSRRVVSGSDDRTLRVWDVESGQTLQTLEGHSNWVSAVAVLDSRRVVSSSDDWTLRVWDVESGQTLQILEGHSDQVSALAVLDSCRVVSGSDDGTLRVWDVESGQTLQTLEGHSAGVFAVAVLDSRRVVSGSNDRTLRVWDVESGEEECVFTLDAPVSAVTVMLDHRTLVAGDESGRVHFFDFVES